MLKFVVLAICAVVLIDNASAQFGGSLLETMMLSQMLSNNNQNTRSTGSSANRAATPGRSGSALGGLTGGAASSNPFSTLLGGGSGSRGSSSGNMFRNMMLLQGNTETLFDMYQCGVLGIPAFFCFQRTVV